RGRPGRRPYGFRSLLDDEVHRDADAAADGAASGPAGIEAPTAGRLDRGAIEVAVAAGAFHLDVGGVAVGVHGDDQHDLSLDAAAALGRRVDRGVHVARGDVEA